MKRKWWKRLAVAVLLTGTLSAYLFLIVRAPSVGLYHDDGVYLVTAKALATGHGYTIESLPVPAPQTKYPPLFPFLLSLIWRVHPQFPANVVALKLIPFAFFLVWAYLIYLLYKAEKIPEPVSISFLFLFACSPWIAYFSTTLLTETLFAALTTGALLIIFYYERKAPISHLLIYLSGVLAGLALLTRSIGIALVVAGALSFLTKRKFRDMVRFLSSSICVSMPWYIWIAYNNWGRTPAEAYYTAQNYAGWNIILNFSWPEKIDIAGSNIFVLLLTPLNLLGINMGLGASLIALAVLCYGFKTHLTKGLNIIHWFLFFYIAIVIAWAWPIGRFIAILLPLVLLFAWEAYRSLKRRSHFVHIAALLIISAAFAHGGYRLYKGCLLTDEKGVVALTSGPVENWYEIEPILQWMVLNTPPDARFAANLDPIVYLYTGRKALRAFNTILTCFGIRVRNRNLWVAARNSRRILYGIRLPIFSPQPITGLLRVLTSGHSYRRSGRIARVACGQ